MPYFQDLYNEWWYQDSKQKTRCVTALCDNPNCGKEFHRVRLVKDKPNYCSRVCSNEVTAALHRITRLGDKNPCWKGGRKRLEGGYIRIYLPTHPNKDGHNCVLEHRYVMEQAIGRYLLPFETVHHKNGKRDDNRIDNLQLMVSKHPSGQTPIDLVEWAEEILRLYKDISQTSIGGQLVLFDNNCLPV